MAKRKRIKKQAKFFLYVVFILALALICYNKFIKNDLSGFDVKTKLPSNKPQETWPKETKISLVATGDAVLHNSVYMDAYDRKTGNFDFSDQLSYIKDAIKDYDIKYYNQESTFGGPQVAQFPAEGEYNIKGYSSYPYFNSPSEFGDAMIGIGFNMVSLATNHSVDCTAAAKSCILNSYDYWSKQKDVVFDGYNPDSEHMDNYIIKEINGITYTMLNFTNTLNGLDNSISGNEWLVDQFSSQKSEKLSKEFRERAEKEIKEAREKVDLLIVAMHWHDKSPEYSHTPTAANKEIAQYLSDLGVDIILGTYAHVLQPFDIINNGKTVVFYSLGNFISNQGVLVNYSGYGGYGTIVGALASMDITKTVNADGSKEIKVDNIGADLIYTYSEKNFSTNVGKNFKVVPFSKMSEKYDKNYKQLYEDYSEVLTMLNKNITIKPLPSN